MILTILIYNDRFATKSTQGVISSLDPQGILSYTLTARYLTHGISAENLEAHMKDPCIHTRDHGVLTICLRHCKRP